MPDELVLEKYVSAPIYLLLDDNGMLQCRDMIIADNVKYFDAVTDARGGVHGIYTAVNGQIIYFRMNCGAPVNKIIASGANDGTDISITEDGGALHILIAFRTVIHHFFTHNGAWVKSNSIPLKEHSAYTASCPCSRGRFAIIISSRNDDKLLISNGEKWISRNLSGLPYDKETVTVSFFEGNLEIYYILDGQIDLMTVNIDSVNTISNTNYSEDPKMANGNVLNSKFIEQVNDNCKRTDDINAELQRLSSTMDNMERQMKQISVYRDNIRQLETQINQLSIKIQELANRFNGVVKNINQ